MGFTAKDRLDNPYYAVIEPLWEAAATDRKKVDAVLHVGQAYRYASNAMDRWEVSEKVDKDGKKLDKEAAIDFAVSIGTDYLRDANINRDFDREAMNLTISRFKDYFSKSHSASKGRE